MNKEKKLMARKEKKQIDILKSFITQNFLFGMRRASERNEEERNRWPNGNLPTRARARRRKIENQQQQNKISFNLLRIIIVNKFGRCSCKSGRMR